MIKLSAQSSGCKPSGAGTNFCVFLRTKVVELLAFSWCIVQRKRVNFKFVFLSSPLHYEMNGPISDCQAHNNSCIGRVWSV